MPRARLERESAARLATRAMTDFPSTTTDPELLSAIGRAAAQRKQRHTPPRPAPAASRRSARQPVRTAAKGAQSASQRSFGGFVLRILVALVFLAVILPLATAGIGAHVASSIAGMVAAPSSPSGGLAPAPSSGARAAAPDCARLTGAQVTKILGHAVKPVATSTGCTWGTRLDDPTTVLVSIRTQPRHAAYEMQLETSAKQHRVVYGRAVDLAFRPATALWVAAGQPIRTGKNRVAALADTNVVVSTTTLRVSDDKARAIALALAAAANRPS